jgi:hypothetical protein
MSLRGISVSSSTPPVQPTSWGRTILVGLAAAVAVGVVLLAFVWPTLTSSVKDIPVAVDGTSAQVASVRTALDKEAKGTFVVTATADRASAVRLIKTRKTYGAILVGRPPEVLTASAGSIPIAQILGQVAVGLQTKANAAAQAGVAGAIAAGKAPAGTVAPTITVKVTDLVPLASTDSRGLGLAAAAFPLVLGGIAGGALIAILVTGSRRRLVGVAVYAVLTGLAVTSIMQSWFGVLQGNYATNLGAVILAMGATASFVVGMNALVGPAGIAVGSVLTMLIGNPLSAATQAPQFLVAPWGAIGQWFVPGASATLLRDLSYFPEANPTFAWLVLAGWTVGGFLAMTLGHFRNRPDVRTPEEIIAESSHPARHLETAGV